jgi:putative ABC transport system permease protein
MIKLKSVNKYFHQFKKNEIHVLKDINLELPKKGLVVLSGVSGSGKTTLLNVMSGLDDIKSGIIFFDEKAIQPKDHQTWDKIRTEHIGFIFQNYYLIQHMSVFDNIAISLRMLGVYQEEDISSRVDYILKSLNMLNYRERLASQLSGGQQQRVAIARALVKNPSVIIADEPTGNLDSVTTLEIIKIIKAISKEKLVILVTHEKDLAKYYGDRIVTLKDGRIITDEINMPTKRFEIEEVDTLYLKSFSNVEHHNNVSYYTNQDNLDLSKDLKIRAIFNNDTLFINVKGVIQKVKLVDQKSNITIKEEAYQASNEQLTNTTYDLQKLAHHDLDKKQKAKLFAFKDSFLYALKNVFKMRKSGKVMLAGFILAGMIIAFSAAILGNYFFNQEVFVEELENNVTIFRPAYNVPYDAVAKYQEDDPNFFINPYLNDKLNITMPSITGQNTTYPLEGRIDLINHISSQNLVLGRMPENDYEFVIDQLVFINTNGQFNILTRYGIWEISQLIGEEVHIYDKTFTIVGVVDTKAQRFYISRNGATLLSHAPFQVASSFFSYELFQEQVTVTHGRMPNKGEGELLAPSSWFGTTKIPIFAFYNETTHRYRNIYIISGLYDDSKFNYETQPFISYNIDIEYYTFTGSIGEMYVHTSNPNQLVNQIRSEGIVAQWEFGASVTAARNTIIKLLPILYVSLFIVFLSGIGIFFMMRSSMLARIFDMSVYRALGVENKRLKKAFMIEMFVLTSLSSIVGYFLGIALVIRTQNISILTYMFYMNIITFFAGIIFIYVVNSLFAIISINGIMNKTPAQMFNQYDM